MKAVGLAKSFGVKEIFHDVTFEVRRGERAGLVGANGAGKTTLMRCLLGEEEADAGSVQLDDGAAIGYVEQQAAFGEGTLYEEFRRAFADVIDLGEKKRALEKEIAAASSEEKLALYGRVADEFERLGGYSFESRIRRVAFGLGFTAEDFEKDVHHFSGGQRTRICLAKALLREPDFLFLDEPTNHLDVSSINWLENFLADFPNTVIVVSHDRHFLNQVCTYICDVDFGKISLYAGNYDFWYQSSQLALQMAKDANKKKEEKIKELQTFIQRFAANAAKSRQATSRKKLLERITLDDIKPSTRRYPYIAFTPDREAGDQLLTVEGLSKEIDGRQLFKNISFTLKKGDKVAFVGPNGAAKTMLFKILMGEEEADAGTFKWGVTTTQTYLPSDNSAYFDNVKLNLVDWLRQYSKDPDETFVRGFLGRMLFSGEESQKRAEVLSGGERVRCMLSRMMLSGANVLLFDEPTDHLDLESITALNNGLMSFPGTILFASRDHEFTQTIANRIIEITPIGIVDRISTYDEYLSNETVKQQLAEKYKAAE